MSDEVNRILKTVERTPAVLEALLAGASEEALRWRPAEGRWTIAEVLVHLLDVETNALGLRARRMLDEENPQLEDFDQGAAVRELAREERKPREVLAEFHRERAKSVEWLRTVSEGALERTGQHAVVGEITLRNHLNQWAFHDLGHVRQAAELIRAHTFYPHTGSYHKYYSVNP